MAMQHVQTWRKCPSDPPNPAGDKVTALAWSPDGVKLAVAAVGRMVWLYDALDGVRRDKFPTKPIRRVAEEEDERGGDGGASAVVGVAKTTTAAYMVEAMAFSPDSMKLAVAQSDGGVYVYKIGAGWGHKKSISHKFFHDSSVTSLIWPPHLPAEDALLVYGLADGAVVAAHLKSNKADPLAPPFSDISYVTALALHPNDNSAVVSGHYDGSLCRHPLLPSLSSSSPSRRLAQHTCAPFALAWTEDAVVAAGNDQRVTLYHPHLGQVLRVFDYSSSSSSSGPCMEFTCAALASPMLALGNFDAIYLYKCISSLKDNNATPFLEHVGVHRVPHQYSATALAWHTNGRRLAVGTFGGVVDIYDTVAASQSALLQLQHQEEQPQPQQSSSLLPSLLPSSLPSSSLTPSLSVAEQLFQNAKTLGFEKGIRLLLNQNQLEAAVNYAMACKDFAYALKLCDLSLPTKLATVHRQHARHLQQQGQYPEAEDSFLLAMAPREAIDMYLSPPLLDFASARRLAERHEPSLVPTILEAQASALLQQQQPSQTILNSDVATDEDAEKHSQAEALYLAAGQPEQALNMYLEARRWAEALRIAHHHLFHRLIDVVAIAKSGRAPDSSSLVRSSSSFPSFLPSQAGHGDILSAVDAKDMAPLRAAVVFLGRRREWAHAWSMLHYQADMERNKSSQSTHLRTLWDDMVVLQVEQVLENETSSSLVVLREAVNALKAHGGPSVVHIKLYRRLARLLLGGCNHDDEQENVLALQSLLHDFRQVLFDVVRRREHEDPKRKRAQKIAGPGAVGTIEAENQDDREDSGTDIDEEFMQLFFSVHYRNILSHVLRLFDSSSSNNSNNSSRHRSKKQHVPPLSSDRLLLELACKVSLTLLRYSPAYIPLDKAFHTAGTLLRRLAEEEDKVKPDGPYKHLAFLLLNRYVDLAEALEDKIAAAEGASRKEGEWGGEDDKDVDDAQIDLKPLAKCTALPQLMAPLPCRQYVEDEKRREEIKAFVLAVCTAKAGSIGRNSTKETQASLPSPAEARGTLFEGLYAPAPGGRGRGSQGRNYGWCVLTGYPLQQGTAQMVRDREGDGADGGNEVRVANKDDWTVWVKAFQTCPWTGEKVSVPAMTTTTGTDIGERKYRK